MRVLVYKRTHNGDPDATGCFGAHDCMGTVRDREFDAVIGVGGIGPEAVSNGIDGEINWVGIGPHKRYVKDKRGPEVLFDHFLYFGTEGPDFRTLAPQLAARMYGDNVRSILGGMSDAEQEEAEGIVRLAEGEPPSPGRHATAVGASRASRCGPESQIPCSAAEAQMDLDTEFRWPDDEAECATLGRALFVKACVGTARYWTGYGTELVTNPQPDQPFVREWSAVAKQHRAYREVFTTLTEAQRMQVLALLEQCVRGAVYSTLCTIDQFPTARPKCGCKMASMERVSGGSQSPLLQSSCTRNSRSPCSKFPARVDFKESYS